MDSLSSFRRSEPKRREETLVVDIISDGEKLSRLETIVDIISDAEKLSRISYISRESCVFKVPNKLYRHDKDAYEPIAFSFGPLHRGRDHLKPTEKIKMQYLYGLITREQKPTPQQTLERLIEAVREIEGRARECYAMPLDHLNREEFTACLVLDGCFIIELLRKRAGEVPRPPEENDPAFDMACISEFLWTDLILLENQIPWFVLELLFDHTTQPGNKPLTQLVINFFQSANVTATRLTMDDKTDHKCKHVLDLWRIALGSPLERENSTVPTDWKQIPSATNLKNAGIKFKKSDSSHIMDIQFNQENGVLEIPTLIIDVITNVLLRNLIGFEQCYPKCRMSFTSYATFLDNLINTSDDIIILQEEGIIVNWLTPDDALKFFNNLYEDTSVINYSYRGLCHQVDEYCRRCWPRWRAAYIQNHFGKPWVIVSEVVGGIVVILALLQTIFTIKK